MQLKVAVIIPAYEAHQYLEECLTSIYQQHILTPNVAVEIFIGIDDCENTRQTLKKLAPRFTNIRAFYFTEHLGPYIIRNTLAILSEAKYLVFFDADDIMPKGFLQGIIDLFDTHRLIRFGLTDFIETVGNGKQKVRVFDQQQIKAFEKKTVALNAASGNKETALIKKLRDLKGSKYFKISRYAMFIRDMFKRKHSGVFAIEKALFLNMNGFRPWPVQADIEFIERAHFLKIKESSLPKNLNFLRRIHAKNLTSNYHYGMGTHTRQSYQAMSKKSIYRSDEIVISSNYTAI